MLKAETGRGSSGQESRRAERRRLSCAASVVRWGRSAWLLLLLSLVACAVQPSLAAPDQQHHNQDVSISSSKRGVCQSVDVRNKMNDFDKFQGCRVIEGFVQILLIEQANETVFADLVYPDLVEITGYLMFFRVQGLKSIGQLFPNLTVIRGHQLFINYALVAFEMNSLQEVGLHSLTDITRGSVRFEKNPMLCHADTIDWDLIAKQGKAEHVISANKPQNECPVCSKACPSSPTDPKRKLCWNRHRCQKVCPGCGESTCTPEGKCCDESCLGSCSGEGPAACRVCRDMLLNGTRCVSSCPPGTYEFMRRRCVTEHECRRQRKPLESVTSSHFPYKPFASECLLECPPGYQERNSSASHKLVCERCDGPCPKSCPGKNVDSIASAQRLRGCTSISGNLLISIREGQNIVKELEQSLSSIERITGGLKIFRSNPLVSLDFLSSLTEISGENLSKGEHTLSILDNANLQYLWNWTGRPSLKIGTSDGRPRVSIHYNPKLCPQYIEQMRNHTGLPAFDELEVSTTSNGDKVACDITEIRTSVSSMSARAVMITWNQFEHHDMRTLLGYVIYYKEAAHANVSIYDSRDACGFDGWMTVDASANDKSSGLAAEIATSIETSNKDSANPVYRTDDRAKQQQAFLTNLKPYTQYVYYVKTYTISMERSGGQSQLVYFTTKPGQPSVPQHLTAYSNASDTAVISWLPPYEPNSNLTHYKIIGRMEQYDPSFLTHRNYCDEPIPLEPKSISPVIKAAEDKKRAEQELEAAKRPAVDSSTQTGCSCTKREPTEQSEKEVYNSIAFEDALHNSVYIKRGSSDKSNRRKRADGSFMLEAVRHKRAMSTYQDKDMMSEGKAAIGSSGNNISAGNGTEMLHLETKDEQGAILSFEYDLPVSQLTLVMRGLRHFGRYNVMVKACREKSVNTVEAACSVAATSTVQMLLREHADDIPMGSFKVSRIPGNDTSKIKLQWDAPLSPNGVIVSYQIEYKNLDLPHHAGVTQCVTNEVLHPTTKEFVVPTNLLAGNYSVKVKALSFAGSGAYTEPAYFYIPESTNQMPVWKMSLIGLMFLLVLMMGGALFGWMYKKKFLRNVPSMRLIATVNPEYVSTVYIPDEWEVARKKIQLLKELGNGSFGMVYEGIAKDVVKGKPELRCAVKTVTENATDRERIEFLKEASVMKGFNTHHVVRLLGVVSQGQPTLVVMELMANGDLKSYLRSHRPDVCENFSRQPPTLKRILQMATEIADGMAYLTAKKFVHRDLAARNCMVADDLTVKIGDFGMTRDVYETDYYRKGTKGLLPVRWMAPESLKDGVFTSFSDVWSYGVVLWEMVTLASQPYQGLSNDQVLKYVIDGGVMERPENCPDSLYIMMRDTWNHKATRRPTFIDIEETLLKEIDVASFERVSFFHSPDGIEARNQNATSFQRIDKDLELVTLQDLREDEAEGEEDSPLRQDFGDFSSFEPIANVKNGGSGAAAFGMEPFHSTRDSSSKPVGLGFLELNSSKAPLKAGFDDFDGVSSNSLASSKDTLNLPFAEDSQAKSVSNSPFARNKSSSKGNLSQSSAGRSSLSPQSPNIIAAACPADNSGSRGSPSLVTSTRSDPEYENRSPESVVSVGRDVVSLRVGFPSMDAIDDDDSATEQQQQSTDSRSASSTPHQQPSSPQLVVAKQQQQQPAEVQQLNNGFIGGAAT